MRTVRIGNTIDVLWGIFIGDGINEHPYDLTGRDLTMYLKDSFGKKVRIGDFEINGHIIKWRYEGKDQCKPGKYSFVLVENEAQDSMYTVDECNAFQLVSSSSQIGCNCDDNDNVKIITLEFRSKMAFGSITTGGGGSVEVDDFLSTTSENPVQNKVITKAIRDIERTISDYDSDIKEAVQAANQASEQVSSLTDKVDKIESGSISWTEVE